MNLHLSLCTAEGIEELSACANDAPFPSATSSPRQLTRGMLRCAQLEAYESAKRSAEQAYSKSKALALQRLQSRNSQAAQSAGGTLPAGRPGQPPAAPPTPEAADRSAAPEDGAIT